MEIFRKRVPSLETIQRFLGNLTRKERDKLPLVIAFYLTFGCNARCSFCSQATYVYEGKKGIYKPHINIETQIEVLRKIREDVPNIYFVGGEPTVYPWFKEILEASVDMDFDTIGVNTNCILFKKEVVDCANLIVASLHSMDPKKIASVYKVKSSFGDQVLENIRRYAGERFQSSRMTVNSVVTGENVDEIYEIAEFCRELGILLNVAPAIMANGKPEESLIDNRSYQNLIDWLSTQRGLMAVSQNYLRVIRDFQPFVCTPQIVPGVHPNGDLIAPCPNLPEGQVMRNILKDDGVINALKNGRDEFEALYGIVDTRTKCANDCHKTCYVGGSAISRLEGLIALARDEIRMLGSRI